MKVVIVAKTRQGTGACIGAITFDGRSLRLLPEDHARENGHFNLDYNIGEVWDVKYRDPGQILPPHIESIVVTAKRRLPPIDDLCQFILDRMPPAEGGVDVLFAGLAQATRQGTLYIAERTGIPPFSTMFWRPDRPLKRVVNESVRIRYCYPTEDDDRTLTFVGFQEPPDEIPAGTLVRVSLAHWWRPEDKPDDELRCYVQLSGWHGECNPYVAPALAAQSVDPALPPPEVTSSRLDLASAEEQLHRVFGFDSFRPAQATIVDHILSKRDTLAVMPTGSGKSLCYQLPALLFPGLTAVVSPLIALMEDQVVQLRELGIRAAFLNSSQAYEAQMAIMHQVRRGEIRLLYAAPETLMRPEVLQLLNDARVDCLAIDEAHCISEWGHDFRPEYRQLGDVRRRLSDAVCLALTATATERVRQDIKANLGITDAQEVVTSFNRENLFLAARERRQGWQQLKSFLNNRRGESGLIYCLTRSDVDRIAADLNDAGFPAIPYHAGLDNDTRRLHHRRFTYEEDAIVVATIAFGMGINKSNVRFVVHYGTPKDIESYYQQIGRAGRDGLRADCLLLYNQQDVNTATHHIQRKAPDQRAPATMRLQEMWGFAETARCRRRPLLSYFNESYDTDNCGMCDNCLAGPQDETDLTIPAQKFLSCVLRTREKFGASYIIDVLRGSSDKRILANDHDQLSTYGIGREYSKRQWQTLTRQFVERGLLLRDMTHGGLSVTAEGRAVLKGEPFRGAAPQEESSLGKSPSFDVDYDRELFELLRAKRAELAAQQNTPAFVIFSDRTLQEMAAYYPQTVEELMYIHGMGEVKLGRYGAAMLQVIGRYCVPRNISSRQRPATIPTNNSSRSLKTERREKTADLFNQGLTIDQVASELALVRNTVIGHLWKAAHFPPGLNQAHLCREIDLDPQLVERLFARDEPVEIYDLQQLYNDAHMELTGDTDWLLRLLFANHTQKDKVSIADRHEVREVVLSCVQSLPGELPRSGLVNLLRGSASGRAEQHQNDSAFGQLSEQTYFELMAVIDALITEGHLILGDDRRLYPA